MPDASARLLDIELARQRIVTPRFVRWSIVAMTVTPERMSETPCCHAADGRRVTYDPVTGERFARQHFTVCGRIWYSQDAHTGHVGKTWDLVNGEHARQIGRPCSQCFPSGIA